MNINAMPDSSASLSNAASHPALEPEPACLRELFDAGQGASAALLALGLLPPPCGTAALLWVQDRQSAWQHGLPFPHGLPSGWRGRLLHVLARDARDALWAMEEGLKCPGIAAVLGELHGAPKALDFTASRRLAVAAERHGVPALLLRHDGQRGLSGARERWAVGPAPSRPHPWNAQAPGDPVLEAELFRSRRAPPATLRLAYDRRHPHWTPLHGDLAAGAGDAALAAANG